MNTQEVFDIILPSNESTPGIGEYINDLSNGFRRGGDLKQLRPLLTHPDVRIILVAAWIISEVADATCGRELFQELCSLVSHSDPDVRFEAIISVAILMKPDETNAIRSILHCLIDEAASVRRISLKYVCLLPDAVVEGMRVTDDWASVQLLSSSASRDQLRLAIASSNIYEQRLAVAGAMRNYGNDEGLIAEIVGMVDGEVKAIFESLPRQQRFL
jgi:hypothetical protein